MLKKRERTQMSHTSCLLVRSLSQYLLRARYRHSSFPPLYRAFKLTQYYLYKKRECGPHSTSWSYESPFEHSLSFREGNSMETSDIRSSFCSNFRSLTRLAMSQVFLWDGLLGLCPWSELGAFQPSLDFLFNSQLKSSKNSVCLGDDVLCSHNCMFAPSKRVSTDPNTVGN